MGYSALLYLDMAVAIVVAAAAGAAFHGVLTAHSVTGRVRLFLAVSLALVVLRIVTALLLARFGWEFASRQITYQLPLVAIPVAGALLVAVRSPFVARARASPTVAMATAAAAGAALLAVVDSLLVPSPMTAAWLTALALVGPPVNWLAVTGPGVSSAARPVVRTMAVAVPALALVAGIGTAWWSSRLPGRYDLADYAVMDAGGAPGVRGGHDHSEITAITDLTGPRDGEPDVRYTLTATPKDVTTSSGRTVHGHAFNGTIPGPRLEARLGDLVEVTVRNAGVRNGVTVHWHGVNVPNAEDGVAGVTQNAVADGERYTYRFRVEQVGTFWYHSHQASAVQVDAGLFGAFVLLPREPAHVAETMDLVVMDHGWRPPDGFASGGSWDAAARVERHEAAPGTRVRLRLINTDSLPHRYRIFGVPYKLVAVDGTDVVGPTAVDNKALLLAAGGRYDVMFTMPARGQAVTLTGLGEQVRMVLGDGAPAPGDGSDGDLDLLTYGSPAATAIDRNGSFTRDFRMVIDRKISWVQGRLGYQWAVNGETFPRMPMFMVAEDDTVRLTFVNRSTAHHPMHLHGHHLLVLARNGTTATGSPWWTDTLNVAPGEIYDVAFVADNPGVWMDHCHDLSHAADGFVMHLEYEGVSTPYAVGDDTSNVPE